MYKMWLYGVTLLLLLPKAGEGCEFGKGCRFMCHCLNGTSCNQNNGSCEQGCDDGKSYTKRNFNSGRWHGLGCQIGNIAYNNSASQSDTYLAYSSDIAVDGFIPSCTYNAAQAHPQAPKDVPTWWTVHLQSTHVVYSVTIYHRVEEVVTHRLWKTIIGVGNETDVMTHKECAYIKTDDAALKRTTYVITKKCSSPLLGTYVSLRRDPGASQEKDNMNYMNFCEVMVEGYKYQDCDGGRWGPGCLLSCNCRTQCEVVTGECGSTCNPGWKGDTCQQKCEDGSWGTGCGISCNCKSQNEVCEKASGNCSECAQWFYGEGCQSKLPNVSKAEVIQKNSISLIIEVEIEQNIPIMYLLDYSKTGENRWINKSGSLQGHMSTFQVHLEDLEPAQNYTIRITPLVMHDTKILQGKVYTLSASTAHADGSTPSINPVYIGIAVIVVILIILIVAVSIVWRRKRKLAEEKGIDSSPSVFTNSQLNHADSVESVENVESDAYHNIGETLPRLTHPVQVSELAAYINTTKNTEDPFSEEYNSLSKKAIAKWDVGNEEDNKEKNRFINIRAYDHSRVILHKINQKDRTSDYINASYIKGYKGVDTHYIASQGPRHNSIVDLWRMVWLEQANRIVMVTNLTEQGKNKCDQYWPSNGEEMYGCVLVSYISEDVLADFTIRIFNISTNGETRQVRQFHFTSWPDHGVPEYATALLEFHRVVRDYDNQARGPLIVHCSAGVGRTGTFIGLDYLLEQAKAEGLVDVLGCVNLMRENRILMIQTKSQYVFLHDAILEAIQSGHTAVPASNFRSYLNKVCETQSKTRISALQQQFQVLNGMRHIKKSQILDGMGKENATRNRYPDIIPDNAVRPYLVTVAEGTTNYINAAYVNGYAKQLAYIVTQAPLPSTCVDLWRLVFDHEISTIVCLQKCGLTEDAPLYWPVKGVNCNDNKLQYGPLKVENVNEETNGNDIKITNLTLSHLRKNKNRNVKLFEVNSWTEGASTPNGTSVILGLLQLLETRQNQSGNRPILIQCMNGASRCGLLVASMFMVDKLKVQQVVDVFYVVKYIRTKRQQLVESLEQYHFLHELAADYLDTFTIYSNFQ